MAAERGLALYWIFPIVGIAFETEGAVYRALMEPYWSHTGATMEPQWSHTGAILEPYWSHNGAIMEPQWELAGLG